MPRCEDFPCCGHGPAPHGDGGGCPDSQGRFRCVLCQSKLPKGNSRSICDGCMSRRYASDDEEVWARDDGAYDQLDGGGW